MPTIFVTATAVLYTITERFRNRCVAVIFWRWRLPRTIGAWDHKAERLPLCLGNLKPCAVPVASRRVLPSRRNPPWVWIPRHPVATMLSDRNRSISNMMDLYLLHGMSKLQTQIHDSNLNLLCWYKFQNSKVFLKFWMFLNLLPVKIRTRIGDDGLRKPVPDVGSKFKFCHLIWTSLIIELCCPTKI